MEDSDKTLSGRVNTGRWTTLEHMAFIEGLKRHGREWRKVSGVVPTRTVVQIRTHAQKYFQKLAKEHGTEAAEQAFSSGVQLGVEMGTRVAESEVDAIFERYPDALAAAKQSERVLPTLPRNTASEGAARGRETGAARSDGARAAASAPRRATKRRRADGRPEAPVRSSSRPPARSRRAIAAAATAEGFAEEEEEETEQPSRRRHGRQSRERSAVPGMEEEEDDVDDGAHPHSHVMGAYGPLPGGPIPPGAVRRRAFDPPSHSGAMRIPMMGHPAGVGRGHSMAGQGNVPPTPTTANAALMLVQGKTSANLAGGKNTPRTLRTAQWLSNLTTHAPGQPAATMVQPAGEGAGIAGSGRRAAATTMAQPPNPWGCAAAAQAQSQEGGRAVDAAAAGSGFPDGAGGVSAVGMHDSHLAGPREGMPAMLPEGGMFRVYGPDGQLVTVLERDPRALAVEHGMVDEHDEAPMGAYPGMHVPVHAPHVEHHHPPAAADGEARDQGHHSG